MKKIKEKGRKNVFYYIGSKSSLPAPQMGQTQSAGKSSKAVPGGMFASGSPFSGSYSYPQTVHSYFFILTVSPSNYSYSFSE